MDGEEKITIRLSSDDLALIRELVIRREYPDENEAVREAVRRLIDSRLSEEEKARALETAARRRELSINDFTSDGTDGELILRNVIASDDGAGRSDHV